MIIAAVAVAMAAVAPPVPIAALVVLVTVLAPVVVVTRFAGGGLVSGDRREDGPGDGRVAVAGPGGAGQQQHGGRAADGSNAKMSQEGGDRDRGVRTGFNATPGACLRRQWGP